MAKQTTKTKKSIKTADVTLSVAETTTQTAGTSVQAAPLPEIIHLGTDVHLHQRVVCRKFDGASVQPAQRMKPAQFVTWAVKQKELARRVVCCYEAGPFGYTLQRQLEAAGITCYVVRPQDWDKHGERVKTDSRDARELTEALARYVAGNKHAMAVVRVPEVAEEQRRMISR